MSSQADSQRDNPAHAICLNTLCIVKQSNRSGPIYSAAAAVGHKVIRHDFKRDFLNSSSSRQTGQGRQNEELCDMLQPNNKN
ncbi:hypothetical protein ElyMa_001554700 [Elysia marginata]|uniref:Uncharacterized protein n=1 Tax=Elysia marginata TaxID=1093978 RepID=A0AAV4JAL6_9GAST|nr:hypothetical protein ElyMa_001554700 [Elysia marginata]